jgi:hypothetical protein
MARHVGDRQQNERIVAGNRDRMSPVFIGGGFDNASAIWKFDRKGFCKSRA